MNERKDDILNKTYSSIKSGFLKVFKQLLNIRGVDNF